MIKPLQTSLIGLMAVMLLGTANAESPSKARATFINPEGSEIGIATLSETPHGVLIEFAINNIPTGKHGFHIHQTGSCKTPDFKSAGGHYKPRNHKHGYKVEQGYHAGDMPNQFAGNDNTLQGQVFNPHVTLSAGEATLFDDDGSAFVVHAGPDDYESQPSGAAGARIACAIIEKP
jgi:Cu-Zn family superoxide dismutase